MRHEATLKTERAVGTIRNKKRLQQSKKGMRQYLLRLQRKKQQGKLLRREFKNYFNVFLVCTTTKLVAIDQLGEQRILEDGELLCHVVK